MKIIKQITFAIIALLCLNSCDKIDELTEIDIDTTFTKEITFTTNASGNFNASVTINLADYSDINDYLNKIESIKINNASYKVSAFPNGVNAGGTVTITSEGQTFGPFDHDNFLTDFQNQTSFALIGVNKLAVLANKIEDTNQLAVNFSGTSEVDVATTMTLKITFDVTVTAQAL
jgi:hypothetical protein